VIWYETWIAGRYFRARKRTDMSKPWISNGILSDGTMFMGPLTSRPEPQTGRVVVEVVVGGKTCFVVHTGEALSASQIAELELCVAKRVPEQMLLGRRVGLGGHSLFRDSAR
jgi:hypothetical protein